MPVKSDAKAVRLVAQMLDHFQRFRRLVEHQRERIAGVKDLLKPLSQPYNGDFT